MKKLLFFLLPVLLMLACGFCLSAKAVTFNELNDPSMFFLQPLENKQCTLYCAASLVRRAALLNGDSNYTEITPDNLAKIAWVGELKGTFEYHYLTVTKGYLTTGSQNIQELIDLLNEHSEGIVIHCANPEHAVLLTDYTDGTFYVWDPGTHQKDVVNPGRYPFQYNYDRAGAIAIRIEDCNQYWYVSTDIPKLPGASHKVTFFDNGGTGGPGNRTVITWTTNYGDISSILPTKPNDTFLGYYSKAVGGEQVYNASGLAVPGTYWSNGNRGWKFNGDVILFAHWASGNVSTSRNVTFNDNGGSNGPGTRTVVAGTSNYGDISTILPTKPNDVFLGYYTETSGGEKVYDANGAAVSGTFWGKNNTDGGFWRYDGDVTLYAHWACHTITFDDNGGSGGPGHRTVMIGTSNYGDISWALPTKSNDTFLGYYTKVIGGEQVYDANGHSVSGTYWSSASDGGHWKYDGDITVYAHWACHTITFDDNGGSGGPGRRTVMIGTSNYGDISWALPTKSNDTFLGYYTKVIGGEQVYDANGHSVSGTYWSSTSDGGHWKYDGDITVYAHWACHTITFDNNGGSGGLDHCTVMIGTSNYGNISSVLPTRTDDTFVGYYTKRVGGEQVYDANGRSVSGTYWSSTSDGGHWRYDGDITLYAHWSSGYYVEEMNPDLILPPSLITIESEAFRGGAFVCVKLSEQTESIGQYAFADCPNLHGIYIPISTTTIDPLAFGNRTTLTVFGVKGSTAEQYAQLHGFKFVEADISANLD